VGLTMRALCIISAILVASVFTGAAVASCNPGRANNGTIYQDGWFVGPGENEVCLNGSFANIKVYNPYVVGNISAWTMIYYGTTGHYAQVGYYKNGGGSLINFLQFQTADRGFVNKFPTNVPEPVVGNTPQYKVDYASGNFHFFIGGTIVDTDAATYGGCDADQAGETHTLADQMPGAVNNRVNFTGSNVRNASTNSWFQSFKWNGYVDNWNTGQTVQYFGQSVSLPSQIDIWDKACSS
jgi:hypothetical protein